MCSRCVIRGSVEGAAAERAAHHTATVTLFAGLAEPRKWRVSPGGRVTITVYVHADGTPIIGASQSAPSVPSTPAQWRAYIETLRRLGASPEVMAAAETAAGWRPPPSWWQRVWRALW